MAALVVCALLTGAHPARADLTAFLGVTPTPENRTLMGVAGGFSLLVVGFEVEYARAPEPERDALPGLRTWSGNVLLQTPLDLGGVQLYGTAGFGAYREDLRGGSETGTAANLGGGVKIKLAGPLRVRLDYRLFNLQGTPSYETYHRFYAGANLRF